MGEKFVVYTAGNSGVRVKRYAQQLEIEVVAFFDNNDELQEKKIDGLCVYTAAELERYLAENEKNGIIIGSQLYQKQIKNEIHRRYGLNVPMIDFDTMEKRYWDEIVSAQRQNLPTSYQVHYSSQASEWIENIMSEVKFWVRKCASPKGTYHSSYCDRLKKRNTRFYVERLTKELDANSVVIDAGCGICSQYGTLVENGRINLISIDPLAYFYNVINEKNMENESNSVSFGMFEFLSSFVQINYADVVLVDNALDHCIDPFKSIIECIKVLKTEGILSLFHRRCEAVYEGYQGLHKWNLDINDKQEFIIWNEQNMINVSEELRDLVDISIYVHENDNRGYEFFDVNIVKKREIDIDKFYNQEKECDKLAQVVAEIMKLFSAETMNAQFRQLLKEI